MQREAMLFHALFMGNEEAYGKFIPHRTNGSGPKVKGTCETIHEPVTEELWTKHLQGTQGLGIVPINSEDKCVWGVIDVDDYAVSVSAVLTKIKKHKFPLVACRSKSGGLHLFLFTTRPVLAKDMQSSLKAMAAALGWNGVEIFPKQIKLGEDGTGNWLNMPYFGETRKCITDKGELKLDEFLAYCKQQAVPKLPSVEMKTFPEGPPCLNAIVANGGTIAEGNRNNFLFNLGVYYRKTGAGDWESKLRMGAAKQTPGIYENEILDIIKRLRKNDYQYLCSQPPICQFCDKNICTTKQFGIGASFVLLSLTALIENESMTNWVVELMSDGDTYEMTVSSAQLGNMKLFQEACMNMIQVMPPALTEAKWKDMIRPLMKGARRAPILYVEAEHIEDSLISWCKARRSPIKQRLMQGSAWFDDEKGRIWFKLSDAVDFLTKKFPRMTPQKLGRELDRMGGHSGEQISVEGFNRRYAWIPMVHDLPQAAPKQESPI